MTAKFNDSRSTPMIGPAFTVAATIISMTPFSDAGSRRIRSSEMPRAPHGENDSSPRRTPSASKISVSTHRPSNGSPRRPSAIENPRSLVVSRQRSASTMTCAIWSSGMSACRRTRVV